MRSSSQNKFGQARVFSGMAYATQHLYVVWVSSFRQMKCMGFFVVPLQSFFTSALFACAAFRNYLCNSFAACVRTFRRTIFPVVVFFFAHVTSSRRSHAGNRTVVASAAPTFSQSKVFSALFANMFRDILWFFWFNLVRAFSRTSVCVSSYVRVWAGKFFTASRACKSAATAVC